MCYPKVITISVAYSVTYMVINILWNELKNNNFSYLYIDLPRAVQIIGGQALMSANQSIMSGALQNLSNSTNSVSFCLFGSSSTTATAALQVFTTTISHTHMNPRGYTKNFHVMIFTNPESPPSPSNNHLKPYLSIHKEK